MTVKTVRFWLREQCCRGYPVCLRKVKQNHSALFYTFIPLSLSGPQGFSLSRITTLESQYCPFWTVFQVQSWDLTSSGESKLIYNTIISVHSSCRTSRDVREGGGGRGRQNHVLSLAGNESLREQRVCQHRDIVPPSY